MFVQTDGWLSSSMGEELVMMSIDIGNYVSISRVGVRIYELLKKPTSIDALCAKLIEEFDVSPEQCRAEVEAFLEQMIEHNAIQRIV